MFFMCAKAFRIMVVFGNWGLCVGSNPPYVLMIFRFFHFVFLCYAVGVARV